MAPCGQRGLTVVSVAAIFAVAYVLKPEAPKCDTPGISSTTDVAVSQREASRQRARPQSSTAVSEIGVPGVCGNPATAVISKPVSAGTCTPKLNALFQKTIDEVTAGRRAGKPDDVLEWMSEGSDCPEHLLFGWRQHNSLVPLILGTKCEPWWRREAIVIMDKILAMSRRINGGRNRRTVGVEWGGGSSSIWLSKRVDKLWVVESSNEFFAGMNATAREHGVWKTSMDGCRIPVKEGNLELKCHDFTGVKFAEMPEPHSVDFISVDSTYCREKIIMERVQELLVPDGGILVVDNSVSFSMLVVLS